MTRSVRVGCAALLATGCAASLPTAKVVADMRGGDFAPVAANGGFIVTGNPLTAWRANQLKSRHVARERAGALAVAADGQACAAVAAAPGLGLRSYRLPGLEPIQIVASACNDMVSISPNSALVACAERHLEDAKVQTQIRLFSFPALEPLQSWGPLSESVEAMSFVGAPADRLAVALTFVEAPYHAEDYRSRINLYDAQRPQAVGALSQRGRFSHLVFGQHGDIFIWAGQSGAQAWSMRSQAQVKVFRATEHAIAVALSPDERLLAVSTGEHAVSEQLTLGGGTIQILDMQSGEQLASFGSADLRAASTARDVDEQLDERPHVRVDFDLLGPAPVKDSRPAFGDMFGGMNHVANHQALAFLDNDTLFSAGRGFFALWTLSQEAIRKLREPH